MSKKNQTLQDKDSAEISHIELLEIVAMSPERAMELVGRSDVPQDMGPADPTRYIPGARVYAFPYHTPKREGEE